MQKRKQMHSHRGLHVISLAENKLLKLGRGHESDVRIADVSFFKNQHVFLVLWGKSKTKHIVTRDKINFSL